MALTLVISAIPSFNILELLVLIKSNLHFRYLTVLYKLFPNNSPVPVQSWNTIFTLLYLHVPQNILPLIPPTSTGRLSFENCKCFCRNAIYRRSFVLVTFSRRTGTTLRSPSRKQFSKEVRLLLCRNIWTGQFETKISILTTMTKKALQ